MQFSRQLKIPAMYMRGGTSKGVFFQLSELPEDARVPGKFRDELFLRVIGSPDPYGKQIDGMGGATSSTSKVVVVSLSEQPEHDLDYLFGQVSIDQGFVDWTGNCGNLTAAVGVFALEKNILDIKRLSKNGFATIRIWQVNIEKTIVVRIPVFNDQVQESGQFELDGVTFPSAEISISFIDPADGDGVLFPTGNKIDILDVPRDIKEDGQLEVTLINSGIPCVFVRAGDLGLMGVEGQAEINGNELLLARLELIRAIGSVKMGLVATVEDATRRQHTPKVIMVGTSQNYMTSGGKLVSLKDIGLIVRAVSMGKLHHAMMGTAAVAIGSAAAVPDTLVNECLTAPFDQLVTFGHPSGTLTVGAEITFRDPEWVIKKVTMSRSARVLMEGLVRVPI